MHLKVMTEKIMYRSKTQHNDIENHLVLCFSLAPPPSIEEDLVSYIAEKTRKQILSRLWKALHYGKNHKFYDWECSPNGDNPASLINQILHGLNLDM